MSQHGVHDNGETTGERDLCVAIVDRLAIANAQSFSLSGPLYRVSMTFAASYKSVRTRRSPHFEMLPE